MSPNSRGLFLACLALAAANLAHAQISTGSLSGTILDPNGVVIPGARMTAKNDHNGAAFSAASSDAGLYVFPSLPVGTYTITVIHAGFKTLSRSGIDIRVARREGLDLRLEIGDVQQTVYVAGEVPVLNTTTSELASNFSPELMAKLPLFNGGIQNPELFISYMPGVNNGSNDSSINGGSRRSKESLIDGASQTIPESGGVVFNFPAAQQFAEFRLLTNNFSAEYGRTGGGIELFLTKSGNNEFHGSLFYNIRSQALNANTWANNAAGRARAKEHANETGGTVGGPFYIPHVYDGRNKTFFFVTYVKDVRGSSVSPAIINTPTGLMKQGDFRELPNPIYDPATTSGNTRTPFPDNRIPSSRFSRISSQIIPLIPDPTLPGLLNNYNTVNVSSIDRYMWSWKVDHALSPKNRLSLYMGREYFGGVGVENFPGPLSTGGKVLQKPENYRLNHDLIITPAVLFHTTFGFTRQQAFSEATTRKGWGAKLGLQNAERGEGNAFPVILFTGPNSPSAFANTGGTGGTGGDQFNWTFHLAQGLTWIRGRHEMKIGWDFRRLRTFSDSELGSVGGTQPRFTFSNQQTSLPTAAATTGHAFASFLLGTVSTAYADVFASDTDEYLAYGYQAFYVQDNWKVTKRLTLNLGMRYDLPLARSHGELSSFDPNMPNPQANNRPGALVFAGFGPGRLNQKRFGDIDWSEFGPRLGFAYMWNAKTVIRGGFSIYYGAGNHTTGGFCLICNLGFRARPVNQSSDGFTPAFNWNDGFVYPPGYAPPPFIDPSFGNNQDLYYLSPRSGIQPRFKNWNIDIQRQLGRTMSMDVAWVGLRGTNLNSTVNLNQSDPKYLSLGSLLGRSITDPQVIASGFAKPYPSFTGTLAQSLRPYPQFLSIADHYGAIGKSWYDALQAKFDKRFGGVQTMANYTWSKTQSLGSYSQTAFQEEPQNNYNFGAEKNLQRYDAPHVLNILTSFDLPFGKGRKWLSSANPAVSRIVSGWNISTVEQYRSSNLLALSAPNTLGAGVIFTNSKRTNLTGQDIRTNLSRTDLDPNNSATRWINPGAFSIPGQYDFGSASRYFSVLRNPPVLSENLAIAKRTTIKAFREQPVDFEYRADFFNLFNRTCFGNIVTALGNVNFGRPTGPQIGSRVITMGLKLTW